LDALQILATPHSEIMSPHTGFSSQHGSSVSAKADHFRGHNPSGAFEPRNAESVSVATSRVGNFIDSSDSEGEDLAVVGASVNPLTPLRPPFQTPKKGPPNSAARLSVPQPGTPITAAAFKRQRVALGTALFRE